MDDNHHCDENHESSNVTQETIILMLKQIMFADGVVRKTELDTARQYLRDSYSSVEATKADEKLDEAESQSIFPLATILRRSLTQEQLLGLRDQLKKIALSDGVFHPYEQDFLALFDELTGTKAPD